MCVFNAFFFGENFDFQTQKDLQIKVDMVKRLMERGYRVKVLFSFFLHC